MTQKRILITGASGFIGSFFVEEALSRGYDVTAGIRKTSSRKYLQDKRIHFLELDFQNKELLKNQLQQAGKFDYIIHNAGLTKTCKPKEFYQVNYQNTVNFIEALKENNQVPDKFIFISSLEAYGPGKPETTIPVTDEGKPEPATQYGKSKLKAEEYMFSLKDFPFLIFRPTGVYGPREKDYLLMIKNINSGLEIYIGKQKQYLSFIYVKDLVNLVLDSLSSNKCCKAYFVSDGNTYTSEDFNRIVKEKLNKKTLRIHIPKTIVRLMSVVNEKLSCFFGQTPTLNKDKYYIITQTNWLCDNKKIKNDFNFNTAFDLKKGLLETIDWYKNNGKL